METYSREGVERLAAGILKDAYNELIDARLADAAAEFRLISYNCYMYYEKMKRGGSMFGIGNAGKKMVEYEIEELEKWFLSPDCDVYCINASGAWFVGIAKKRVADFAQDKIPVWMAKPTFDTSSSTGGNAAGRRRDYDEWKKERDAWREAHNLVEVK